MSFLFHEVLYRPLFNALMFLVGIIPFHDFGLAVIVLTIFIRLILLPLFYKGAKDQAIMQRLAPKLKEAKEKNKNNREAQAKAMFELYREHKVNPITGFLLLLAQLPILFALYKVFLEGFSSKALQDFYSFVPHPGELSPYFLGFLDLTQTSIVVAVLAGASQFILGKITMPASGTQGGKDPEDIAANIGKQMNYIGPIMITLAFIYFKLPAVVGLYWLTTTLFSVIQQVVINKKLGVKTA